MKKIIQFAFSLSVIITGCKKFVQVEPPVTSLVGASTYGSDATAAAAVTGIYSTMTGNSVGGGVYGTSTLLGLSSDEFTLFAGASDALLIEAYKNALLSTSPWAPEWNDLYNCIYKANSAIAGITGSMGVDTIMKRQLIGESEFVRAFCYFYLTNIYGDVPLTTTPNYLQNVSLKRTPKTQVYQQILADLNSASKLLGNSYLTPTGSITTEKARPNALAAQALMAKVYLYMGRYDSAEAAATIVINSGRFSLVKNLDSAFLANNSEAIWQLESPNSGGNAPDGYFQIGYIYYKAPVSTYPLTLSDSLMAAFEPGDLRKIHWVDSAVTQGIKYYFPYKYKLYYTGKPPTEYATLFRLAEQYLIRAEARANIGGAELAGALSDLNIVRARAGLPPTNAMSQANVLNAILKERRVELFTEYGNRWFDLIRTGNINTVMQVITPLKGGTWEPTDVLYPIPINELQADPNLTQNPGY